MYRVDRYLSNDSFSEFMFSKEKQIPRRAAQNI